MVTKRYWLKDLKYALRLFHNKTSCRKLNQFIMCHCTRIKIVFTFSVWCARKTKAYLVAFCTHVHFHCLLI